MIVREEQPQDHAAVYRLNCRAFESTAEAEIVEELRRTARPPVSLVAVEGETILGHILLTPVTIRSAESTSAAMALGPMAVLPEHQNQGIGSRLVEAGLRACRDLRECVVFVLGHPEFYPRFGFEAAASRGLHYRSNELDPYFMVAELEEGALRGRSGVVEYLPAFERA